MKRLVSLVGVLALVAIACGGTSVVGSPSTTSPAAVTTTVAALPPGTTITPTTALPETAPPTTTTAPPAGATTTTMAPNPPPLWTQADLPAVDQLPGDPASRRVVLVAADDVLNVRTGAGVDHAIVGMLDPRALIALTGDTASVDGSGWVEIVTPHGTGWVNSFYLGTYVDPSDFNTSEEIHALFDRMAEIMAVEGDLTEVVSRRGLFIAHNAPLVHFGVDELPGLMSSTKTHQWGSAALEPNSPELPFRTFAAAVGDRFVSAYTDTDTSVRFSEIELGGNGTLPEYAIPFQLSGFNFVSVYDPGDDPQYGGLDWTAWYVSIDYEEGGPVVVAMTLNEWSP